MSDFYEQFDDVYSWIEKFLSNYCKSIILQNYFVGVFKAIFYANLINLFFINLNKENVKGLDLPRGNIGKIKRKYKDLRKDIKSTLSLSSKNMKIVAESYNDFKIRINACMHAFPKFQKLIEEIEKKVDLRKAKGYLKEKEKEIRKLGKRGRDIDVTFMTTIIESYVQKEQCLPINKKITQMVKAILKEIVPNYSQKIRETLDELSKDMLDNQREFQKEFESQLYQRWKEPLDLLECLIKVSLESGERQKNKLSKMIGGKNDSKYSALIKIHARALQISNEILVLLKAGYPDGANSRWRSLHELAVISFFLLDNSDDVSRRYLDHEIVRRFKEAGDYRTYCKELSYLPLSRKEFNMIRKEKEKLCSKYGDRFDKDYGWIPSSLLRDRNFRSLEKSVKMDKLHPFYNLSCDAVHGGAKGFYRLGLMPEAQDKMLLVGPSNYGLADPLQNTAISLSHVTICLLTVVPDIENIIAMQVILSYIREIGSKAVEVQQSIENENRKHEMCE